MFYNVLDGLNPADPASLRYGDGLPDSTGTMTTRFTCQIPLDASPQSPARAGIYGHGPGAYTHLKLPTIDHVQSWVGAVAAEQKIQDNLNKLSRA